MKPITTVFLIFLLLAFVSGIYFCATHELPKIESMQNPDASGNDAACPDLLIKSGNSILLYNSKKPEEPGVNPLPFYNLDEYINYLDIQHKNGIHCPVLFLQEENNTQGKSVYRIRPDVFNPQGGLPTQSGFPNTLYRNFTPDISRNVITDLDATKDHAPWNVDDYHGFDPTSQYVGRYTILDALHDSTYKGQNLSENPMDDNWGGVIYTKSAVDSGKYDINQVLPPSAAGPFTEKSDNIHNQKKADQTNIFS